MSEVNRRNFIKKSALASLAFGLSSSVYSQISKEDPLFDISLAEWSINKLLFSGKSDHLNFAIDARKHGINAVEYVNQFFKDKAKDKAYLREMKDRADGEGVRSVLIMCDGEGALGASEEKDRIQTVENHKKWVEAAKFLGCHAIRVNGYSSVRYSSKKKAFKESQKLVADGLQRLCKYAEQFDMSVMIENHGGFSSNGKWLSGVIEMADHKGAGTLPDFGNFRIDGGRGKKTVSYDAYQGIEELMPHAKGVSLKITVWDDKGNQHPLDYERMMKIVLDAGFRGYCGIEHGTPGKEWESIVEIRKKLLETRDALSDQY